MPIVKCATKEYRICSSNSSKKQRAGVRIKTLEGVVLAQVSTDRSQPLSYLQRHPASPERLALVRQLQGNDVPEDDIAALLRPTPTYYERKSLLRGC